MKKKATKEHIPFYVINEKTYQQNSFGPYNVMPYLIEAYESTKKNKHMQTPVTFDEFKEFVKNASQYQYWSRCEYEILIASWPFGKKKMIEEITDFMKDGFDSEDWNKKIGLCNIITKDMQKMDIYEQIIMNHDVVTKILMENVL